MEKFLLLWKKAGLNNKNVVLPSLQELENKIKTKCELETQLKNMVYDPKEQTDLYKIKMQSQCFLDNNKKIS
jgi:hypothetical protein